MHALVGALKEQAEEAKKPRAKSQSKVKVEVNVPGLDRDLEAPHLEITIFF